ncbi:DNA-binding response regulator [Streptacidiphilus pinicola]|uniref:DNA-binding response regulator n=1 Tax=Streptacidiphilus pinicola TaxID=2219663 RepID=A0A2X0IE82_9ACTN|nr:response regulator transcription factor [Streptacidiphilus pinicola]RAG81933.1 DNA-binding response regulator [Streptacidiphilus pinicola]
MIRVMLVDDHQLVRMGLRVLIDREDDLQVVAEAEHGRQALAQLRAHRPDERPDVMLLDIRMPDMDGLELLRHLAVDPALRGVRVVVVTTFEIDHYVFEALQAGASGFVLKDSAPSELVHAIRVVAAGEALLSPSVTRLLVSTFAQRWAPPAPVEGLDSLTEREREIAAWVATGRSNDEIADALFLSPATVRTHVTRAMTKLNARSRAQLVVLAVRAGLTVTL